MLDVKKEHSPIRLIALDMDGTVLLEDKTISPRTKAAITAALAQGVQVVPATGRAGNGILPEFLEVARSRYAITANGARVVDLQTGECLLEALMPQDIAIVAFDALQKYECVLDMFQDGKGYSTKENLALNNRLLPKNLLEYVNSTRYVVEDMRTFLLEQTKGIEKWTMFFADDADRVKAWAEMQALGFEPVSSLPRNMELSAPGVSKGHALSVLAEKIGVPMCQTMACGDGGNDLAMIVQAGIGVAMENGMEAVKAAADYVADSNENDGVAKAIERFVL